ncbi:MAG: L-arginine-specific L-amino acid ligase [Bacteroidota bacterium]|jgi:biotin carboxylase
MKAINFLCISCEFKGVDFLRYCKSAGNRVFLVTTKEHQDKPWPRESLDDIFFMDEVVHGTWNMEHFVAGLAYLMRSVRIDRIIALDDFDVEEAADLREHFRIPGMGQTTARHFRDKLAMRMKAEEAGLRIPAFTPLFNDEEIREYTRRIDPPYMVKPRMEAATKGIRKVHSVEELWRTIQELGENRHNFLLEQFRPGDIYHVDALTVDGKPVFTQVSQYLSTPWDVAHGGGIFRSVTCPYGSEDELELTRFNSAVMAAFGMVYSASHTEFIKSHEDGRFYFLETSSRVGGAHLADMVEFATGINLWGEWARIETAVARGTDHELPPVSKTYAGIINSLSRQQHPDTSAFNDPEIVWRLDKEFHIGFIVKSDNRERILHLLDDYARRIRDDYHAQIPPE